MILFVKEGCGFCEKFKDITGLVTATVKIDGNGTKITVDGVELPAPVALPGFPALIDGKDVYVGLTAVEDRLLAIEKEDEK